MDSVGLDLEPQNPGPGINNGQYGPRPRTSGSRPRHKKWTVWVIEPLGPGPEPLGPGPEPLGPGPEPLGPGPLGSGPEPLGSGPDVFNRPLDINNGECGPRPTHQ